MKVFDVAARSAEEDALSCKVVERFEFRVVHAEFEAPDGEIFHRDIVRSPGAVGVVPIVFDVEGNASVLLVRQYRAPYDELVLETERPDGG